MKKTIIGITSRVVKSDTKEISKVPQNIINYVIKYGGIPLIIPNLEEYDIENIINQFDGFIIPGGNTFTKTDEYIIKYAINKDLPLIGICAGMQAIGNLRYFDTDLADHSIPTDSIINHAVPDEEYVHNIEIYDGILKDILEDNIIKVNSRHKCKIVADELFVIDAKSPDGIIEAIHIPNKKFIIGVQWHPEDLDDIYSNRLFKKFINKCK